MRRVTKVVAGTLALGMALAPAAFAAGSAAEPVSAPDTVAAEEIDATNAAPSVVQEGQVVVDDTPVTLPGGETVETGAEVEGVPAEEVEVFVTGTTSAAADGAALTEAQAAANAAIAEANATGNTVESMIENNSEVATVLADAGVSAEDVVISTECYVGIQRTTTGAALDGTVTTALKMASEEEVQNVVAVLCFDSATGKWKPVAFTKVGNKIVMKGVSNGVYRFVSKKA